MKQHEEKAKELVEKMYSVNNSGTAPLGTNPYISREFAKQCALIAVDEIIELGLLSFIPTAIYDHWNVEYWQQVKESINNEKHTK